MGASLCTTHVKKKRIATSSWVASENDNPFESSFSKKERLCLRESYQRLIDPKEIIGKIFVDIVNDLCPEMKKVFGVDRAPKATMLKMPKFGGHVSRTADFFEQITAMIGSTENLTGAWQLARKTGRLHAKVPFLETNQNQMNKNYFAIVNDAFLEQFVPYLSGAQKEEDEETEKKRVRFVQTYSPSYVADVWRRFLTVVSNQLTESFELERQKGLNADNQKTLAPHQRAEEAAAKKRRQDAVIRVLCRFLEWIVDSEAENAAAVAAANEKKEEMFEDPF